MAISDSKVMEEIHYRQSDRRMTRCHSDDDGYCTHEDCPQLRDNEPYKTGRHCPLDNPPKQEKVSGN
jgi:hypothetical protein